MSVAGNAQEKGGKAVGANLIFDTSIRGIGVKYYRYNVSKPFRVESSFNYYINRNRLNWDFCVNGHLLIPTGKRMKIYPLAGLGITRKSDDNYDYSDITEDDDYNSREALTSANYWCCSIGCGIDYKINDRWTVNVELNHKQPLGTHYYTHLMAGLVYSF